MAPTTNGASARLFDIGLYEVETADEELPSATSSLSGKLSEMLAAHHLMARGHEVYGPMVDDRGVDLLVVDGRLATRVQVKNSGTYSHAPRGTSNSFSFSLARGRYRASGEYIIERQGLKADFFVCHAVPINAWWVIPRDWLLECGFDPARHTAISLRDCTAVNRQIQTKYNRLSTDCRDAWHLIC
jgi:hypothetical protein